MLTKAPKHNSKKTKNHRQGARAPDRRTANLLPLLWPKLDLASSKPEELFSNTPSAIHIARVTAAAVFLLTTPAGQCTNHSHAAASCSGVGYTRLFGWQGGDQEWSQEWMMLWSSTKASFHCSSNESRLMQFRRERPQGESFRDNESVCQTWSGILTIPCRTGQPLFKNAASLCYVLNFYPSPAAPTKKLFLLSCS